MRRIKAKGNKPTRTELAADAFLSAQAECSNHGLSVFVDQYENEHKALMIPVEGSTEVIMGEALPMPYEYKTEDDYDTCDAIATDVIRDTLQQDPDTVSIDASTNRLRILHDAGALEMGLDLSVTIQAKNSMEKLLAHQMAVLHVKAMEILSKPDHEYPRDRPDIQIKMMNIAARLLDTYQGAMSTLSKTRNAGKQTVVVKQIRVEGGQNVIADNVTTRGGRG